MNSSKRLKVVFSVALLASCIFISGCLKKESPKAVTEKSIQVEGCPETITNALQLGEPLAGKFNDVDFTATSTQYINNQLTFQDSLGNKVILFLNNTFFADNGLTLPEGQSYVAENTQKSAKPSIAITNTNESSSISANNYIKSPYQLYLKTDRFDPTQQSLPGKIFLCFNHHGKLTQLSGSFNAPITGVTINTLGEVLTQDDSYDTFNMVATEAIKKLFPASSNFQFFNHQLWREAAQDPQSQGPQEFAYLEVLYTPAKNKEQQVKKFVLEKRLGINPFNRSTHKTWKTVATFDGNEVKEAHRRDYVDDDDTQTSQMYYPAAYLEKLLKGQAIYNSHFAIQRPNPFYMIVTITFQLLEDGTRDTVILEYESDQNAENPTWELVDENLSAFHQS